ncbi:hypothetical protein ACOMHN_053723 [Nucella lapillus]
MDEIFVRLKAEAEALKLSGKDVAEYIQAGRNREAEREERQAQADRDFELELLRVRSQTEIHSRAEANQATGSKIKLPYMEDKDNIEAYLAQFE